MKDLNVFDKKIHELKHFSFFHTKLAIVGNQNCFEMEVWSIFSLWNLKSWTSCGNFVVSSYKQKKTQLIVLKDGRQSYYYFINGMCFDILFFYCSHFWDWDQIWCKIAHSNQIFNNLDIYKHANQIKKGIDFNLIWYFFHYF